MSSVADEGQLVRDFGVRSVRDEGNLVTCRDGVSSVGDEEQLVKDGGELS